MIHEAGDISVIIPFYNREEYIDEAVQSVLAQTLKPLEIIIVNYCSRDVSRRYLHRYERACTIVHLPKNVALAAARNAGIRHARGEFIALLHHYHISLPRKLGYSAAIWPNILNAPPYTLQYGFSFPIARTCAINSLNLSR